MKRAGFTLAVAAAVLLGSGPLWAQEPAPISENQRSGFFIGFGFGPGSVSVGGTNGATGGGFSNMLRIGHALSQNVLIGVELNGWISTEATGVFGTLTGALQLYPSATGGFFLTGGVGVGAEFNGEGGGIGLSGLLGLGYDVRIGRNTSLTPFLNGLTSSIEDSWNLQGPVSYNLAQIGVGVTFH